MKKYHTFYDIFWSPSLNHIENSIMICGNLSFQQKKVKTSKTKYQSIQQKRSKLPTKKIKTSKRKDKSFQKKAKTKTG